MEHEGRRRGSGLLGAAAPQLVDVDGGEQDQADRDVLPERVDRSRITKPFSSTAGISAPMTVPDIRPRPPKRLVPPITTAEIAASASSVWPETEAVLKRARSITPTIAASRPISTYRISRWRPTLMPARAAESGLAPIA